MRRNWFLLGIALLVAVLAIGAIACDDDDDDGGALSLIAVLTEMGDSSATGVATITEKDGVVKIELITQGLTEGPHANHVHHGSCADLGEVHVPLEELQADAEGKADGATDVTDIPIDHFETGHYVAIHVAGNDTVGDVISCGDVVESSV